MSYTKRRKDVSMNPREYTIDDIISLRNYKDHAKRGYDFERFTSEVLPWTTTPPDQVSKLGEQIDHFFEYNGRYYLAESKAKLDPITPGSHDWEDYELKLRKRSKSCIGLFLSLYDVNPRIYETSADLNKEGFLNIIIAGKNWDDIMVHGADFLGYVIDFLTKQARTKFKGNIDSVDEIWNIRYNSIIAEKKIRNSVQISKIFRRRNSSQRHTALYIKRKIDRQINEMIETMQPSKLCKLDRTKKHKRKAGVNIIRDKPTQVVVVRDSSGSGKTTLSVEMCNLQTCITIARSAYEDNLDDIRSLFAKDFNDYALREVISANKPLLYVIDSLDETNKIHQKYKEIKSLLKEMDEMNELSKKYNMICYPILVIFTVREHYWRDWEAAFEGRVVRQIVKQFSLFNGEEYVEAITKYSQIYEYSLDDEKIKSLEHILSHPFTLEIYSKAHEYEGEIQDIHEFDTKVLDLYFKKKKDDTIKRHIPGYNAEIMIKICMSLSRAMLDLNTYKIQREAMYSIIEENCEKNYVGQIFLALESEEIIASIGIDSEYVRFKHNRFLEYFISKHVSKEINEGRMSDAKIMIENKISSHQFCSLHQIVNDVYNSSLHKNEVSEILVNSKQLMNKQMRSIRYKISRGEIPSPKDIQQVKTVSTNRDPELCWNAFFILAARKLKSPRRDIIEAFTTGWDLNKYKEDAWKMIDKLHQTDIILDCEVSNRVLNSDNTKNILVYIDKISKIVQNERRDVSNIFSKFKPDSNKYDPDDFIFIKDFLSKILKNN